jgi:hypothetical protein
MGAMRFHHELSYDAPPDRVRAMLLDQAFRERVCAAQHAETSSVRIEQTPSSVTVVVEQSRRTSGIPGFARAVVGDHITLVQRETWPTAGPASMEVVLPGKPGRLDAAVALTAVGAGTRETVDGELKVSVPLVGGKVERLVAEILAKALRREQETGHAWLAGA